MSNKLVLIVLLSCLKISFCSIQCKDENNNEVDWFVMYKLPKNTTNTNKFIKHGVAYMFITSKDISNQWKLSTKSVNDTNSLLGRTLSPIYNNDGLNVEHYLYNDQPPVGKASDENGHSKGVLAFGENGGFWLIHSVPHFPPASESSFSYPETGTHFGQSALCVSLSLPYIDAVAGQLMYVRPFSYSKLLSDNLKLSLPNLSRLIDDEYVKEAPFWKKQEIQSRGGTKFTSYAKTAKFSKDLYADWLASDIEDDLSVETWPNGPGRLPSNCTLQYKVNNVAKIQVPHADLLFTGHVDHSKWAVAREKNWICVGGINRAEHQEHRGGGTLCFKSQQISEAYRNSIAEIEQCALKNNSLLNRLRKFIYNIFH